MAGPLPNVMNVEGRCERHQFERAVDLCGRCGAEFCADCLVYSFGPKKPPFCLPCAVEAAGVRQGAGFGAPQGRKERKELRRRRAAFLAERAAGNGGPSRHEVLMDDSWLSKVDGDDDVASSFTSG